jgi:hypothetical protein
MFVSRTRGGSSDTIAGLMFTRFLGGRTTASVGVTSDGDEVRVEARSVFGVATGKLDTAGGNKTATLAWQGGLLGSIKLERTSRLQRCQNKCANFLAAGSRYRRSTDVRTSHRSPLLQIQ